MKNSCYDRRLIELSLAKHLFFAEEYEKALVLNLRIGAHVSSVKRSFTDKSL
jgi:hypothetical protein